MIKVARASAADIPPNTAVPGLSVPLTIELAGLRNIFPSLA
jgi:hypothetical protein